MKGIQNTSSKTYRQLMGNGLRYEIPKFQRDYTWEFEQWDDLWQDIISLENNEESEHYMGYLVLQTSNNKNFQIIDGQQRLTTLSILILAVLKTINQLVENHIDPTNNLKRKENLLNSYIGYIDPVTLISNNKLKLNRNSDDYYRQQMVLLKDLPLRNTNTSEKHMRDCFHWYFDKISKKFTSGEALAGFIDGLVDKLFFTAIEVSDQINAFKVFETLNARGVQLSSSDLLKNYLFSVVDETKPHISEIEELEKIWSRIVGKLGENKFEDYLRYYWNSFNKTVSKKNLFKTVKYNIKSKEKVFELIRDLLQKADIFLAIQSPEDIFWRDYLEVRIALSELKLYQIRQTNSLLLEAYSKLTSHQFKKIVQICSVISFRYNVIGGLNPNAQEEIYNSIALNIHQTGSFTIKDFQAIYVPDVNFENDFATKSFKNTSRNHKIVKYVFSKIEEYKFKNEISPDSDLFNIEHILPESADESWGDFSQEEIDRAVYRIGNLTLLEKKLNKEADVKKFTEKLEIYSNSNSQLSQEIADCYEVWNESKISSRQKILAKEAKSIWRIQELN